MSQMIAPMGWEFSGPALIKAPFSIIVKNDRLLLKYLGHTVSNVRYINRKSLDIVLASEQDAREHWEATGAYLPINQLKRQKIAKELRDYVLSKSQRKTDDRRSSFTLSNRLRHCSRNNNRSYKVRTNGTD
jgi:hypothetical protein